MIQSGQCARFLAEAFQPVRIADKLLGKRLEGDIPLQPGIASAVHFPHSSRANALENLIRA